MLASSLLILFSSKSRARAFLKSAMNWTSPGRVMSMHEEQKIELYLLPRIDDMTQLIVRVRALRVSVRSR